MFEFYLPMEKCIRRKIIIKNGKFLLLEQKRTPHAVWPAEWMPIEKLQPELTALIRTVLREDNPSPRRHLLIQQLYETGKV